MKFTVKKHFIVIDSGKPGPLYVAPHAGIAFNKPGDMQDEGTHYIAYRLVQSGGKALISTITREKDIGIDFFRQPPDQQLALEYYRLFKKGDKKQTFKFRKKYAWVARNQKEHNSKQRVFNAFWDEVKKSRTPILFIHRQFLNSIRHPSILDVIPFNYDGQALKGVEKLNRKYKKMFKHLLPMYKEAFNFKSQCVIFKEMLEKKSKLPLFRGQKPKIQKRIRKFNEKIRAMPYLAVTYKQNFRGKPIRSVVEQKLSDLGVPVIQLEISEFLTNRYPQIAVYLTRDLIKTLTTS